MMGWNMNEADALLYRDQILANARSELRGARRHLYRIERKMYFRGLFTRLWYGVFGRR